jgi:hypothetical protein
VPERRTSRDVAAELDVLNRRLGLEGDDRWTIDAMQPGDYARKYRVVDGRNRPMFGTQARFTAREMFYMIRAAQTTVGLIHEAQGFAPDPLAETDRAGSPRTNETGDRDLRYPHPETTPGGTNPDATGRPETWSVGLKVTRVADGRHGMIVGKGTHEGVEGNLRVRYAATGDQPTEYKFVLAGFEDVTLFRGHLTAADWLRRVPGRP